MMSRDIGDTGRNSETLGRIALVACRFAMLVGVVDHDAQPRSKGLKPAHDFRIGQIIGKYVEKDRRIRSAFIQETEQDAARLKTQPRIGISVTLEGSSIEIKLRLADRRHDLALVRKVALVGL